VTSRDRAAGVALFLVVTAAWLLGLVAWELDWLEWIAWSDWFWLVAVVLSAGSVVATGYLGGRTRDALLLGWIPGAAMTAIGFALTPEPGGDERGGTMVFFGVLVLVFAWPIYFFPLISVGAGLRRRRLRQAAATA
jgi:hypothetical protein